MRVPPYGTCTKMSQTSPIDRAPRETFTTTTLDPRPQRDTSQKDFCNRTFRFDLLWPNAAMRPQCGLPFGAFGHLRFSIVSCKTTKYYHPLFSKIYSSEQPIFPRQNKMFSSDVVDLSWFPEVGCTWWHACRKKGWPKEFNIAIHCHKWLTVPKIIRSKFMSQERVTKADGYRSCPARGGTLARAQPPPKSVAGTNRPPAPNPYVYLFLKI